jgi:dGTP triphosphohydrolase
MSSYDICTLLDASKKVPNIEGWPVSKVAVLLVDSKKENCFLRSCSITDGAWSLIEKDVDASNQISEATSELRTYLFENVYHNRIAKSEEDKAIEMLRILFEYFVKHPNEMPLLYQKNLDNESIERCVCDYVSSMTDRYAIDLFRELYVPSMWRRHL